MTNLVRLGLLLAIASGPIAVLGVLAAPRPPLTSPVAVSARPGVSEVEVSAVAVERVRSWLTGGDDDPSVLFEATAPDLAPSDPAAEAIEQRDPAVRAVAVAPGRRDTWWVTVGATTASWTRFYGVEVQSATDGLLSVVGIPSAVAGPVVTTRDRGAGSGQVPSSHPLALAVAGFLTAYLVGDGDPARWSAPDVALGSVDAGYVGVRVTALSSEDTVSPTPADGDTATVVAAVELISAPFDAPTSTPSISARTQAAASRGPVLQSEYVITLTARDQRWEVTSLLPGAVEAPPSAVPTSITASTKERS